MTKEAIAKAPRTRPQRTKIGTKNRLTVANKHPDYEYRFVNDVKDKVEIFKANGWEVAPSKDVTIGDSHVEQASSIGSAARIPVGLVGENSGHSVLMRIPKDWYEQDQKEKMRQVDELEQTMKQDALNGNYGTFDIKR